MIWIGCSISTGFQTEKVMSRAPNSSLRSFASSAVTSSVPSLPPVLTRNASVGIIYRLLLKNVIDSTRLAVIVQIVPYHFRIQPSAGFRRKIFMVYLSQPTGNAILDGHADRIPLIDPINIQSAAYRRSFPSTH